MLFNKSPKTIDEQIELLISRGMIITDRPKAHDVLTHVNYYRLGAYWLPFEQDHENHIFRSGTCFDDVLNLYIFDRKLRLLVLDAIERIEVSCRTQWAYFMAHNHGSHSYLDSTLARKESYWVSNLQSLENEVKRSKEVFIEHYKNKYTQPDLPPIWAVSEVMSLGLFSRWFTNLKPMATRKKIANQYNLDHEILASFLRHLTEVRNICAHHSRLWNRKFTVTLTIPKNPTYLAEKMNQNEKRRVYTTLVMLNYLLNFVSPNNSWQKQLIELIEEHKINRNLMGFPNKYS
ncbi:Abi family protein [Cyanobacterium aponinum AL20118]|uniref:Abi family protein n=1 Tax=Cyanobacterium aponinum AL20115 TaxID=3090662 RepID=A0AAF0Z9F7_9CHRO|nr:Abi family protein [Cyanobacterium aponinum]WPF87390.1 Abi family protein [Cyanobacterium aponinum AL20115]